MKLKKLPYDLSVCRLKSMSDFDFENGFFFLGKTDEEISFVCCTENAPVSCDKREDGWKGFRIEGELDFSLIGILSKISGLLAENKIGIFAVSTFNTDYILVKEENFSRALQVLSEKGYVIV